MHISVAVYEVSFSITLLGDQMLKMIGLQHIQGFWTLSRDMANLLNIDIEVIKSVKIHQVC